MAAVREAQLTDNGGVPPSQPERRGGLTPVSLFIVLLVGFILVKIQFVLILILVSLVLATTLARPVQLLEKRLMIPRGLAILSLYVAFFGALILIGFLIAPSVQEQVDIFQADAPIRLAELRAEWQQSSVGFLNGTGQELLGTAIEALDNPPDPDQDATVGVLSSVVGAIVGLFATLVITFYYLMERQFIRTVVIDEMSPKLKQRAARIWDDAEAKVGGWLRGQLTLCLIVGTVAATGYGIIGVPFWPVLGLWAAITEIIPVLGPWLGGIPAVILALTVSTEMAVVTALLVVGIQTLENWVLVPRVMKGAVGLTPLTVFIAITAGAEFYGIVGTLLAIPIAAFVQVIVTTFLDERRDANRIRPNRVTIPAWRWMRASSRDIGTDGAPGPAGGPAIGPIPATTATSAGVTSPPLAPRPDRRGEAPPTPGPATSRPGEAGSAVAHRPGSGSGATAQPVGSPSTGGQPAPSRPAGPKWTAEHLGRGVAPEPRAGSVEDDPAPPASNRTAIGPGGPRPAPRPDRDPRA